jgi:hypothetical protein
MAGFNKPYSKPQQSGSSFNKASTSKSETNTENKSDKIQITGLYEGKADSVLVLKGSVKEDIMIPAGYQIKIFKKGGVSKNGKELPPFELVAQPARTMKKDA